MRMNNQTKLVFALEHIAHLHDLIEGNYWEDYLRENLNSLESVLEAQLTEETFRKQRHIKQTLND
tara:strand:- start:268 stop:462 length:195 start_codon:yes stop_codon:yes gene_type:complete